MNKIKNKVIFQIRRRVSFNLKSTGEDAHLTPLEVDHYVWVGCWAALGPAIRSKKWLKN